MFSKQFDNRLNFLYFDWNCSLEYDYFNISVKNSCQKVPKSDCQSEKNHGQWTPHKSFFQSIPNLLAKMGQINVGHLGYWKHLGYFEKSSHHASIDHGFFTLKIRFDTFWQLFLAIKQVSCQNQCHFCDQCNQGEELWTGGLWSVSAKKWLVWQFTAVFKTLD